MSDPSKFRRRGRWRLIRDIAILQVKLLADALRDLLLAPVALIAGLVDLVRPGAGLFEEALRIGRATDRWINLFGHEIRGDDGGSIDELARRLEAQVRLRHREGGLTASARKAVDRALDSLSRNRSDPP